MWLSRDPTPALEKDQQTLRHKELHTQRLVKPGLRIRTKFINSQFRKPLCVLSAEHGQTLSSASGCFLIIFTFSSAKTQRGPKAAGLRPSSAWQEVAPPEQRPPRSPGPAVRVLPAHTHTHMRTQGVVHPALRGADKEAGLRQISPDLLFAWNRA